MNSRGLGIDMATSTIESAPKSFLREVGAIANGVGHGCLLMVGGRVDVVFFHKRGPNEL